MKAGRVVFDLVFFSSLNLIALLNLYELLLWSSDGSAKPLLLGLIDRNRVTQSSRPLNPLFLPFIPDREKRDLGMFS